jgi:anti-sigma regulatory factor (Ser/Thr protein kinase)
VFVAVGANPLAALRDRVGDDRPGVTLVDTLEWHPDTSTRLRAFNDYVGEQLARGASRIRLVGEPVWPANDPGLELEWKRYESVLNAVLGPYPVSLVCTYDTSRISPSIAADALRTHPMVRNHTDHPSDRFEPPERLLRRWVADLVPPPRTAARFGGPLDLHEVRGFVQAEARAAGVAPDRARDLCLAASEILTNALVHGGGHADCLAWAVDGTFTCEIRDAGGGIADPLAGYFPPTPSLDSGRGLWLARQLVDLLQIVPSPGGTTVRLNVDRRGP